MDTLLLGRGNFPVRRIRNNREAEDFSDVNLTTIDINPDLKPDILMDLNILSEGGRLPFDDCSFDEIHAYDVLEHLGRFGDWRGYFTEFKEYHRVLRNNGCMYIVVPINQDALADVGHSRLFHGNHFAFLNQKFYELNNKQCTCATDYRWYWKENFKYAKWKISS